ncbi:MAG: DUF2141 domain-containing protein [Henriciella sp.]|nr:DUF2141 domain-containing protein [Henriciella sp.]
MSKAISFTLIIGVLIVLSVGVFYQNNRSIVAESTIDIAVVFDGAPVDNVMHVCLWTTANTLPDCNRAAAHYAMIETPYGAAAYVFRKIPSGIYAAGGYVDENGNGKLDFLPTGMPAEPFALTRSNPAETWPSFQAAALDYQKPASLHLKLASIDR